MIERTDDPEVKARLLRMVTNCPSGRLEVALEGGEMVEPAVHTIYCHRPEWTAVGARRHPDTSAGWLHIRGAQPGNAVPLRSL